MRYFVKWYDEYDYTEVAEEYILHHNDFIKSLEELSKRYYEKLPCIILLFDKLENGCMYFTRTYIYNNNEIELGWK